MSKSDKLDEKTSWVLNVVGCQVGPSQERCKMKLNKRIAGTALSLLALLGVAAPRANAAATGQYNGIFYSGNAAFNMYISNAGSGMINLSGYRVTRGMPAWNAQICDYQSAGILQIPNGYAYYNYSGFHNGCQLYSAFDDLPGATASYPAGTNTSGWWVDVNTGGAFKKIGDLTNLNCNSGC